MKRLVSVVLIITILSSLFALSVSAVAPIEVSGFASGADILDDRNIHDFGNIVLGEQRNVLEIPIKWENFTYLPGNAPRPEAINSEVMNNIKLEFTDADTGKLFGFSANQNYDGVHYYPWTPNKDAHIILIAKDIGTARDFVKVTYNDHVQAATVAKLAPISGNIIDPTINKEIARIRDKQLGSLNGGIVYGNQKYTIAELPNILNQIEPGDEIIFALDTEMFDWVPDINNMYASVRKSTLDNNSITAIKRITKGSELIDYIGIENINGSGHVVLRFKEYIDKSKAVDFDLTISLARYNSVHEPSTIRLAGTLEHEVFYANENNNYVYTGDGIIIEAEENVKNLVIDLGKGAKIITNIYEGQRYYIRASDEIGDDDRNLMTAYPNIKKVLTIYSDNIKSFGNEAMSFELDRIYYVYDTQGNLLGRSDEKLPYKNKFYFALEELTIEEDFYQNSMGYQPSDLEIGLENVNDNPMTGGYSLEMQRILTLG